MKLKNSPLAALLLAITLIITLSACDHKVVPPQQSISPEEANVLEEEYKDGRYKIINDSLKIEDTRDFWFSIDTLKKYIEYVEVESKRMGKKNLGIRVYFAAYPKESQIGDPGLATVFFVPTSREDASGVQKGFFPIQPPNQNNDSLNALNYAGGGIPPNEYQ